MMVIEVAMGSYVKPIKPINTNICLLMNKIETLSTK